MAYMTGSVEAAKMRMLTYARNHQRTCGVSAADLEEANLSVPERHQMKIAKETLKMSDAGAMVAGGMTKDEAREFLRSKGWTDERIAQLEAE